MKFVLKNLFLIICGLVVVLALGGWYYLSNYMQPAIQKEMADVLGNATKADNLKNQKNIKIGDDNYPGPVTLSMINAKDVLQKNINQQASDIQKLASGANVRDRVKNNAPVLLGQPLAGYLPKIQNSVDPHDFKNRYSNVLTAWQTELLFGTTKLPDAPEYKNRSLDDWGLPPTEAEVKAAWELDHNQMLNNVKAAPGTGAALGAAPDDAGEGVRAFYADYLIKRAEKIRMYVTPGALQKRSFATATAAPSEKQIFEACVDCFVIQDVVRAIQQVNGTAKNVMQSPIKRLDRIVIGNSADMATGAATVADPGDLFVRMSPAQAGSTVDYARGMTGRAGTSDYDVSHVMVTICVDPSYLNKFINAMYLQNNSYTVLSCRMETQDPFEMASTGYLYGSVPVVKVDILFETLFFREWTKPIMPEWYRNTLGIPPDPSDKK